MSLVIYTKNFYAIPTKDEPRIVVQLLLPVVRRGKEDSHFVYISHKVWSLELQTQIFVEKSETDIEVRLSLFGFGLSYIRQWGY